MLLLIRLGLAGVLAVAAMAKLLDRSGTQRALIDFRVPASLAGPLSFGLPVVELAIAVALLPSATAQIAAAAAAALFACFAIAVGLALRRGERPDCNCFGRIHSTPAGPLTLARNVLLGAVAALVAIAGPGAGLGGVDATSGAIAAAALLVVAAVAGQAWFSWQLFRQNGRLITRVRALEEAVGTVPSSDPPRFARLQEGDPAPTFELPSLAGPPVSLDQLLAAGRPLALVFTDPGCGACDQVLSVAADVNERRELTVAVISRGDRADNRSSLNGHALDTVLLQADHEVGEAYGVKGFPAAVMVDGAGLIAGPVALGPAPAAAVLELGGERPEIEVLAVGAR